MQDNQVIESKANIDLNIQEIRDARHFLLKNTFTTIFALICLMGLVATSLAWLWFTNDKLGELFIVAGLMMLSYPIYKFSEVIFGYNDKDRDIFNYVNNITKK